jgi:Uma2 family endonuclease
MSRVLKPKAQPGESLPPAKAMLPPLENGDHLDQKTFHARYEAMPDGTRAELIGGIVIMPSPLKRPHGKHHKALNRWLDEYEEATPGIEGFCAASAILGPESELQPDLSLLIFPEYGGQTWEEDEYIVGAPELAIEVASSTEAYDLHEKKRDYERAGVKEYLVVALRQQQVFWFVRRRGRFKVMTPGADGILRSEVFPGLWLDPAALLRLDRQRVLAVLREGLDTAAHAAFVARLAARGRKG